MKNIIALLSVFALISLNVLSQHSYSVVSPDGNITVEISVGKQIEYSITHGGDRLLNNSSISMKLSNGTVLGINSDVSGTKSKSVESEVKPVNYKKDIIIDNYNEFEVFFKDNFKLIFRAYNDGVAYRIITDMNNPFIVENEHVEFNFSGNPKAFVPYVANWEKGNIGRQFYSSFENTYEYFNVVIHFYKKIIPLMVFTH